MDSDDWTTDMTPGVWVISVDGWEGHFPDRMEASILIRGSGELVSEIQYDNEPLVDGGQILDEVRRVARTHNRQIRPMLREYVSMDWDVGVDIDWSEPEWLRDFIWEIEEARD